MNFVLSTLSHSLLLTGVNADPADSVVIQTHSNAIPKVAPISSIPAQSITGGPLVPHWPTTGVYATQAIPVAGPPTSSSSRIPISSDTTVSYAVSSSVPSERAMQRGDVFGLVTVSENEDVNGETVVIYNDGTLGIKEPTGPGYLFQSLLLPEYNLMVVPEPLTTVKINDKGVFYLNSSLFNPSPIFDSRGSELRVAGGSPVVCPSWNSVLVLARHNENVPCQDAVKVSLGIIPITAD